MTPPVDRTPSSGPIATPEVAPRMSPEFSWQLGPAGRVLVCVPLGHYARHLFSTTDLRYRGAERSADRDRVAAAMGLEGSDLVDVHQVHGCAVASLGPRQSLANACEADALVTTDAARAASVVVADCVPILIADRRGRAVAAVHAGWRGTAKGIVAVVMERLMALGVQPDDLVAAVGPSIGPCCYQVDEPVRRAFGDRGSGSDAWFRADGIDHWRLDLWAANESQLIAAGLAADAVHVARLCTAHHPDSCWSYRRDGPNTGRLVAAITLRR